ncbi:hypothetical protein HPP92_007045 [Vanilla planifolia]|uniref:Integral membrane protein n=1 Tax=Vanilla planifolia TaxID=51239 RepID=A0A835RFW6_VANPL|nr:hypothetical protein HPP92_007045 [Vanilla planifolia]
MAVFTSSTLATLHSPETARILPLFHRIFSGDHAVPLGVCQSTYLTACSRKLSTCLSIQWSHLPCRSGSRSVMCKAVEQGSRERFNGTMYDGVYGPWTIEPSDIREVILYRSGLVTVATSFVLAASAAFIPEDVHFGGFLKQNIDFLYFTGAGGLGLSLLLIHIYVAPIKRFLQALWALGVFGSVVTFLNLAKPLDEGLVQYVIDNPVAIWFVGPLFAALTGLVFKEGLCYGKLEAGVLTFIIPGLLLGHLTGLMEDGAKLSLLALWMALFVVFAGRKFQQPIKDDIGDKSIFIFNDLSEEEKKTLLQKLEEKTDG